LKVTSNASIESGTVMSTLKLYGLPDTWIGSRSRTPSPAN
jgi:hypothetical protein